jgi:hypothetical protein
MIVNTDIDIDVANRTRLLTVINNTPAMIERDGKKIKHNTGVYFHEVPENPFTGMCEVDYKKAEDMGFFKIDVLNVNIYEGINSKAELDELLDMEPMWELLEHEEVVSQCFHIHGHFDVVKRMKPRSLAQLAAVLAVIRPAKRHLLGKDWDTVFASVWDRPDDDAYFFKKAHAHAYAQAIVLQLNQIVKNSYAPG